MRVAHLSDTHLGYAEFDAKNAASGLNVRELDTYRAFEEACSAIRAAKPDLVLHSGDLFDHPRPPNHAVVVAFQQFGNFARDGIPVVLIAGNHSLPATRGTVCLLKAFNAIPGISAVVEGPRRVTVRSVCITAIPHLPVERDLTNAVQAAKPDPSARYNILLLHAGLRGGPPRAWTEAMVPRVLIKEKAQLFDYIALGHYHRPMKVAPMAWYSGATERFQGDRSRGKKGFLMVDLVRRRIEHHPVHNRPRVELASIECAGLDPVGVLKRVREASTGLEPGSVVGMTLSGLSRELSEKLDLAELRRAVGPALHVDLHLRRRAGRHAHAEPWDASSLPDRFKAYAMGRVEDPELLESVLKLAGTYFDRSKEESET